MEKRISLAYRYASNIFKTHYTLFLMRVEKTRKHTIRNPYSISHGTGFICQRSVGQSKFFNKKTAF